MKKLIQILMIISLGIFMNSCYYDAYPEYEDINSGGGGEVEVPDVVSFATNIQPLFSKCIGCHKGSFPSPDLRAGNSYGSLVPEFVTAGNSSASRLYNYLPGNGHHDVGFTLSTSEIALIKAWIDQGAVNN